jgi:hypothetical protein
MANGSFNSLGGAYHRCPISDNQQRHEERRKRDELDRRVARFLGQELYGKLALAAEVAEAALDAHGLRAESRDIERRVTWLVDGIEWFGMNPFGAHGITARDVAAMRLLAAWAAMAVLLGDRLDRQSFNALTEAFRVAGGFAP